MWILVLQRVFLEFFLNLVFFPLWWYTIGVKKALVFCFSLWQGVNILFSPGLWLKNIFVPMYGQQDWQGRIISFFIRLFNVIGRGIALLIGTVGIIGIFALWLIFPIFVVYMLVASMSSQKLF